MPVHETKGGYKYGETGKTYKNKKDAIKQALAIAYSKARKKGRKPTQDEIETEIKGNPEEHIDKTAGMTFANKRCDTMSQRTQEILNNYFIQKEAGIGGVLKSALAKAKVGAGAAKNAVKSGATRTANVGRGAGKAVDDAVVRGSNAVADKIVELSNKGLPKGKYVTDSAPRLAAYRLGFHIANHPRAYGYGALGAGTALLGGGAAAAATAGGDKGILANTLQLAKDNPLATAGVVGGATGITAASIAYALAPEKTKKLAATIAGLGGLAVGGAGTYAGLKA